MKINQHDIKNLTDDDLKRLVVLLDDVASRATPAVAAFWQTIGRELIRAKKKRRSTFLLTEAEFHSDNEPGGFIG